MLESELRKEIQHQMDADMLLPPLVQSMNNLSDLIMRVIVTENRIISSALKTCAFNMHKPNRMCLYVMQGFSTNLKFVHDRSNPEALGS